LLFAIYVTPNKFIMPEQFKAKCPQRDSIAGD
jgi:hypothetical protein